MSTFNKITEDLFDRKLKVGILGGAFDPITTDHINIAKFVLNTSKIFDEVHLMPCFKHMHGKNMAPIEDRLEMCRIAVTKDPNIKVSDFEFVHKLSGETYQLVKMLEKEGSKECNFSIIIGQDNANIFDKWSNSKELELAIRFVIVPRIGVEPDTKVTWYRQPPHIFLMDDGTLKNGSSTQARNDLKTKGHSDLLDANVQHHIINSTLLCEFYGVKK